MARDCVGIAGSLAIVLASTQTHRGAIALKGGGGGDGKGDGKGGGSGEDPITSIQNIFVRMGLKLFEGDKGHEFWMVWGAICRSLQKWWEQRRNLPPKNPGGSNPRRR